jgi:hypothetical protein
MTTNEPKPKPATPRTTRRRTTTAASTAAALPAQRHNGQASDEAPTAASDAPGTPVIDEDGAWIEADAVSVRQGAVGRVDARDVRVAQGAIGAAKGDRISIEMGAVGAAVGGQVSVSQAVASSVFAREVSLDQTIVRTLIAQEVHMSRPSAVVFMVAQRVTGDVRVLLDWRGALAFGAGVGLMAGLFGRGRRGG